MSHLIAIHFHRSPDGSSGYYILNDGVKSYLPKVPSRSGYFIPDDHTTVSEPQEYYYRQIDPIIQYLGYSQAEVATLLEVDPSTLSRWRKQDKSIGKLRTKAVSELDQLIAKGVRIFGSATAFREWLNTTNISLKDQKPVDLLKELDGFELVDEALDALSWGSVM